MVANDICTGSFGTEYIMHACLNAGCATKPDHSYNEMCVLSDDPDTSDTGGTGGTTGGTTFTDGNPIPGPNGCPAGYDVYVEHGAMPHLILIIKLL